MNSIIQHIFLTLTLILCACFSDRFNSSNRYNNLYGKAFEEVHAFAITPSKVSTPKYDIGGEAVQTQKGVILSTGDPSASVFSFLISEGRLKQTPELRVNLSLSIPKTHSHLPLQDGAFFAILLTSKTSLHPIFGKLSDMHTHKSDLFSNKEHNFGSSSQIAQSFHTQISNKFNKEGSLCVLLVRASGAFDIFILLSDAVENPFFKEKTEGGTSTPLSEKKHFLFRNNAFNRIGRVHDNQLSNLHVFLTSANVLVKANMEQFWGDLKMSPMEEDKGLLSSLSDLELGGLSLTKSNMQRPFSLFEGTGRADTKANVSVLSGCPGGRFDGELYDPYQGKHSQNKFAGSKETSAYRYMNMQMTPRIELRSLFVFVKREKMLDYLPQDGKGIQVTPLLERMHGERSKFLSVVRILLSVGLYVTLVGVYVGLMVQLHAIKGLEQKKVVDEAYRDKVSDKMSKLLKKDFVAHTSVLLVSIFFSGMSLANKSSLLLWLIKVAMVFRKQWMVSEGSGVERSDLQRKVEWACIIGYGFQAIVEMLGMFLELGRMV